MLTSRAYNENLKGFGAVDGVKEVKGTLTAYNDGVITIEKEDGISMDVVVKETSYVKLCDDEGLF